jgi:hypothetical protein
MRHALESHKFICGCFANGKKRKLEWCENHLKKIIELTLQKEMILRFEGLPLPEMVGDMAIPSGIFQFTDTPESIDAKLKAIVKEIWSQPEKPAAQAEKGE